MRAPRILPLIGVAAGGVLAINALAGARDLPGMLSGARAFAEGAAKPDKAAKREKTEVSATTGEAADAAARAAAPLPAAKPARPVCAPTAAELAKEAGLSPAELQVLQSLGERRGQLDQRESDLNTQLALMAAAEAKLDAKVKALTGLKSDIQGLLVQADQKQATEIDRLVKVYEGMKPKDAAPRMVLLDDSIRLPIAAKMKERSLSAIVAQMPPAEAKKLTEGLAARFLDAKAKAENAKATADKAASQISSTAPAAQASADPVEPAAQPKKPVRRKAPARQAQKKPAPRKAAPQGAQAAAQPAPSAAAPPAKTAPPAPAPAKAAAAPAAPAG